MYFPGLTSFDYLTDLRTLARLNQVLVHSATSEQRTKGYARAGSKAVGQYDECKASVDGRFGFCADSV